MVVGFATAALLIITIPDPSAADLEKAVQASTSAVADSTTAIARGLSNLIDDPHPGTPDETSAKMVGPGVIRMAWHDTGSSNPSDLYAVDGSSDATLRATRGALIAHHLFAGPDNDPVHFVYVVMPNLKPGQHCFRVWQREGDYLSKLPSAWTCATVPVPAPAPTGMAALFGPGAKPLPAPLPAPQLQRLHPDPPAPIPAPQLERLHPAPTPD